MYRRQKLNNTTLTGYSGVRGLYRKGKFNRRKVKRRLRFDARVRKAMEDVVLSKACLFITTTNRFTTNSSLGQQGFNTLLTQNSAADLTAIYNNITVPVTGGQPSSTLKTMEFTVTSYLANIIIKNQTNQSCILDMYMIRPRMDTQTQPSAAFQNGLADSGALANTQFVWGVTPYMSPQFTALYKVIKKTQYLLTAGSTEIINYRDNRNYKIDYEKLAGNSSEVNFKNWTTLFFFIIRGEPVNDSVTKTNISTVLAACDFIMNETYWYTFVPQNVTQVQTSGTFGTITTTSSTQIETGAAGVVSSQS